MQSDVFVAGKNFMETILLTRQSSCVNERGIPNAAYQVLHLLSCTGGGLLHPCQGGTPPWVPPPSWPGWGVPHLRYPPSWPGQKGYPIPAGEYPTSGTPHPDLAGGYPIPAGGYPTSGTSHQTWPGSPPIIPCWGTPHLDLAGEPP